MVICLRAFGVDIPMVKDPFLEHADAKTSEVQVRVIIKNPVGVLNNNPRETRPIAVFRRNWSFKQPLLFELQQGPPEGWTWVIHNGKILAYYTSTLYGEK